MLKTRTDELTVAVCACRTGTSKVAQEKELRVFCVWPQNIRALLRSLRPFSVVVGVTVFAVTCYKVIQYNFSVKPSLTIYFSDVLPIGIHFISFPGYTLTCRITGD